jgi:hypothetical protein
MGAVQIDPVRLLDDVAAVHDDRLAGPIAHLIRTTAVGSWPDPKDRRERMHAVVVRVTVNDPEAATQALREDVVPTVSQAPGFVAGYWTRGEGSNQGLSMVVFESEDAANAAAERIPSGVPDAVTLDDVEVREVIASA